MSQRVFAEGFGDDMAADHFVQGFLQIGRQAWDTFFDPLFLRHHIDVAVDWCRKIQLALNSIKTCLKHYSQCEVRVSCRVRITNLNACAKTSGSRDTDHRAAVARRPRYVARRFVTWNQTLVRVNRRVSDSGKSTGMLQNTCHVIACGFAQTQCIALIVEHILAAFEQGLVCVHTGSVHAEKRLRHKSSMQAVLTGYRLHDELEGLNLVSGFDGVRIFEVDFVLAGSNLMVGGFNFKAHFFKGQYDFTAAVLPKIHRRQIEISTLVIQFLCRVTLLVGSEQEEFRLRSNVHRCIAHFFGFLETTLQNTARIAGKRCSVRHVHITNQTCNPAVCHPRENNPSAKIRIQVHIGFFNTYITFDGRSVEHHFIVECFFKLAHGNFDVFDRSQQVSELQTNKTDVFFFGNADNILFGKTHDTLSLSTSN
ncbi:hypothetical protein D3C75_671200 [compost metagenome]